ncbi:hypothetical protein pb186bvf_018120 [Paramecium bursaria]
MKQTDVFSQRETSRPQNQLTAVDSLHSSSLYAIKMKEITDIYKEQEFLLWDQLQILKNISNKEVDEITTELEPQIQNLRQLLSEQVKDYDKGYNDQLEQLQDIRNDDLELERGIMQQETKISIIQYRIGDQILIKKYDLKF